MSEDKEKEVLERTRRNHSDMHAVAGNVRKREPRGGSRTYGEFEVRNPVKAVAIVAGAVLACFAIAYVINLVTSLIRN